MGKDSILHFFVFKLLSPAVSLHITRFNIKKFYMVLALR